MEYKLVFGTSMKSLEDRVNELLKEGWRLWRSPIITRVTIGDSLYYQTMLKG